VVLVVAVAGLGLLAAWARGFGHLARVRVRAVRLLVAATVVQAGTAALAGGSSALRTVALVLTVLLVALFLGGNWRVTGVPLMAAGLLLNCLVVVANLGMPVSLDAAARAGLSSADLHLDTDPLHEAAGPGTHLASLGDVIPVALPWRPQVVSRGDVLVAAGVGLLLVKGAPRSRRPRPRPPAQRQRAQRQRAQGQGQQRREVSTARRDRSSW
jgi:hypothetical protein